MSMLHRHRWVAGAVAGAAILSGLVSAGSAVAAPGRSAIPGTHPDWAVSRAGHQAPAVTSGAVNLRVYLAGQDPAGLAAYATAVSDPTSASYGNYLTPAQAQARFGTTSAQIQAVESWLKSAGLTVTGMTSGAGGYVSVTGTVAEASQAFGVGFANYTDPTGQTARAPEAAATVPSSVSGNVLAVSGLDTGNHQMKPGDKLPPPGPNYWVAPPTSTYYGSKIATNEPTANGQHRPWTVGGYTPAADPRRVQRVQLGHDRPRTDGRHRRRICIADDAVGRQRVLAGHRQPAVPPRAVPAVSALHVHPSPGAPDECGAQGWYGEQTLDVESVHDMAPDANVRFIAASSCLDHDLFAADALIVNRGLASIVSNSFGEPYDDATIQSAWDQVFQYGAIEGIGFMFSSGDSGYEDPTIEDPASPTRSRSTTRPRAHGSRPSVAPASRSGRGNNWEWEIPWGTLLDPLAADGLSWTYTPPPARTTPTPMTAPVAAA